MLKRSSARAYVEFTACSRRLRMWRIWW
jgi:hypothetical protein